MCRIQITPSPPAMSFASTAGLATTTATAATAGLAMSFASTASSAVATSEHD